jgi:hypothetical protein
MTRKIKMCIQEYIRKYYAIPQPNYETIRRLCVKGMFDNAIKEGKKWYFVVEQDEDNKQEKKS